MELMVFKTLKKIDYREKFSRNEKNNLTSEGRKRIKVESKLLQANGVVLILNLYRITTQSKILNLEKVLPTFQRERNSLHLRVLFL